MFKDKIVVITGAASGIGKEIASQYKNAGAKVCIIDINENDYFVGDLADKKVIEAFVSKVISNYGKIDILINNALPLMKGIDECSYEEFEYALKVGVTAPFYLAKLFDKYWSDNASIINISSSRDRMSQPQTESYSAAKGGISALTHSLAISLSGRVRVNSISPGWINTTEENFSKSDNLQQPVARIGKPADIANMVLFLTSDKAGFITGENICIDGGMTKQMIYSGDYGWSFDPKE
jgi:Dehydrogenases with different specificities (related to short-chain alcohol dehydrogenases)